jgi:proline-specific peptidase
VSTTIPAREGYIPFHDYKVWYRVVGEAEAPGKLPLLTLHGGPGAAHDYLEPLEAVAATGRRVIFYDQLGCGKSDHPHNPSLWTVPLFVEEVGVVREALGLERIHLLGQSWGGMLAMEYALTKPSGLHSLILADSLSSIPLWVAEADHLRADLPVGVQATLAKHEQAGTYDDKEYEEASLVYYKRHVCRAEPWPDCVMRTFDQMAADPEVYRTMWGPTEFLATGNLGDWDITPRLGEIGVPTMLFSGRYDEATPRVVQAMHDAIPGAEWVIFEQSSHMPHVEETERYLQVLSDYLDRVEAGG